MNTTLKQAVKLISEGTDFRGKSLYAETIDNLYIVYSYGKHFPLAAYDHNKELWYLNTDKYSATTSRHQSIVKQALHDDERVILCTTVELQSLLRGN